jgi:cytochrome-b5 reductase
VILIAGGAGITPIYSLTKGILADPADKTRIDLLWGVNGTRDIVLKNELEELERRFPERLKVTYAVSGAEGKPEAPSLGDEEKYKKGYVNEGVVKEAIERCQRRGGWGDEAKGTKVFLCGPPKMEDAVAGKQGLLGNLGVQKKEIHRF